MSDEPESRRRKRNAILQALEAFREICSSRIFFGFLVFLYVCENEGVTLSELANLTGLPITTASRIVKMLSGAPEKEDADEPVLFELEGSDTDQRLKFVYLTPMGRELRDRLEDMISEAAPIRVRELT